MVEIPPGQLGCINDANKVHIKELCDGLLRFRIIKACKVGVGQSLPMFVIFYVALNALTIKRVRTVYARVRDDNVNAAVWSPLFCRLEDVDLVAPVGHIALHKHCPAKGIYLVSDHIGRVSAVTLALTYRQVATLEEVGYLQLPQTRCGSISLASWGWRNWRHCVKSLPGIHKRLCVG